MSEQRRITSEDLALFAMQLLPREEAAEVSAYLNESLAARRELAEIQGDLALYAHTVELHSPPAQARERLTKQVAREKKLVPIDRASEASTRATPDLAPNGTFAATLSNSRGLGSGAYLTNEGSTQRSVAARVMPWVGWGVAAALAVTTGNLYRERNSLRGTLTTQKTQLDQQAVQLDHLSADAASARQILDAMTDPTAMRVTLTQKGQAPALPQGRATYVPNKGTLIFLANNLQPLQPTKTYELWLIPAAAGATPIPAGTFRPDERGNATVIMPPLPKGVQAKAFGVTVEDEGGASTPTLPIILVGT